MAKPRLLFISGRETAYIRNRVLIKALEMHFDLTVLTPVVRTTVGRSVHGLARFAAQRPAYDVCFVGFYGQPLAIALSVLQRKPIILDAYVSTFDTLCKDRTWFAPKSPLGRIAYWLDYQGCKTADHILVDTEASARYFADTFGVPARKHTAVYVGCDESLFFPRGAPPSTRRPVEVFYYGAFLPLHGTRVIVEAAHLLKRRSDIHFVIGGNGPQYKATCRVIRGLQLTNVELVGWIPLQEVPDHIAHASICLGGHFSDIPKAARVISTKTFQFIAMRKPTIVGDNRATRELFLSGRDVCAVPMNDPAALAEAISTLADDPALRDRIASGGYNLFRQRLTTDAIGRQLTTVIEGLL